MTSQNDRSSFGSAYLNAMTGFHRTDGRAARREFWCFILIFLVIFVCAGIVDSYADLYFRIPVALGQQQAMSVGILSALVALLHVLPNWSISVRRMHDLGLTSWWLILGLFPLVGPAILFGFFVWPGDTVENTFGPVPN